MAPKRNKAQKVVRNSGAYILLPHMVSEWWDRAKSKLLLPKFETYDDFARAYQKFHLELPGALEKAINSMEKFYSEREPKREFDAMNVISIVQKLALELPDHFSDRQLPLSTAQAPGSITVERAAIPSLLACAFLSLFPDDPIDRVKNGPPECALPDCNFKILLHNYKYHLPFLLNYFERIPTEPPKGTMTVTRKLLAPTPEVEFWTSSQKPLCDVTVRKPFESLIDVVDMVEADFANEYLGGGVLMGGNVQEETRFLLSPECIAAMVFTQKMDDNESVWISGVERYSKHTGYGGSLRWDGSYTDTHIDSNGQPLARLAAFDALVCYDLNQYENSAKLREVNKALVAFETLDGESEPVEAIATGNWGCGVFGGCLYIKSVLQWLAASESGRPMHYFPFDKTMFGEDFCQLIDHTKTLAETRKKPITVGDVAKIVFETREDMQAEGDELFSLLVKHL